MGHHLETARRLRQEGHRLTPQRLAVLEVIKSGPGHMTVNEVLEQLRAQYPTLTVPTVYRNLQWLTEVGASSIGRRLEKSSRLATVCLMRRNPSWITSR